MRRPASLVRIRALVLKEWRQAVRDPSSILIAFILPAVLLVLFGYGVNLDARHLRIGIALESDAPSARRLADSFFATDHFDPVMARHHRDLAPLVTSGRLRGLVIIPQDFDQRLVAGDESPVLIITDGSETNTANFVRNYTAGVVQVWQRQEAHRAGVAPRPAVRLQERFWYNAELASRNSLVPGSLAVILTIVGTLLTALVVSREWERGTMEAILATPARPFELLLSKVIPYFALGMLSMLVSVGISIFLFGVPYRGGVLALLVVSSAFLITALGQGLFISTVAKNQFIASQGALVSGFLPAFLLSGFIFEIASMPWLIRQLSRIIPARYLVTNYQTLFLVGDVWPLIIPNIVFLLILGTALLTLALRKSPRRLEAE